jgi:hypothetical protein
MPLQRRQEVKKNEPSRPVSYIPSIHPNMSHNNIIRMREMSKAHAAEMNKYNQASEGFIPLSQQSPPSNTLYGRLPSKSNKYAIVNKRKKPTNSEPLYARVNKTRMNNLTRQHELSMRSFNSGYGSGNNKHIYGENNNNPPINYATLNGTVLPNPTGPSTKKSNNTTYVELMAQPIPSGLPQPPKNENTNPFKRKQYLNNLRKYMNTRQSSFAKQTYETELRKTKPPVELSDPTQQGGKRTHKKSRK